MHTVSETNNFVLKFSYVLTQSVSVIVNIYLLYITVCMSLCNVCRERVQWHFCLTNRIHYYMTTVYSLSSLVNWWSRAIP